MKKIAVAFLGGCLAVALAGCSSSSSSSQSAANSESQFSDINLSNYKCVDISHLVESEMPADPSLKLPEINYFAQIANGDSEYNLETIGYCPHTGTHMDAPFHVLNGEGTIESGDPTVLIGPACIIRLDVSGDYEITAQDVKNWEAEHGEIQQGDAVMFDTNQDKLWESDPQGYISSYPHLAAEPAEYLVQKGARFVGCEAISPDTSEPTCHKILLGGGVEVVENLCNLDQVGADRCYVIGTFANVQGSTGVWTRLLAYYQ